MSDIIKGTLTVTATETGSDHNPCELVFRVAAGNGDRVDFPCPFVDDAVFITVADYYDGAVFNTCGVTRQAVQDRHGFTLSKMKHVPGGTPDWNSSPDPVEVHVAGRVSNEELRCLLSDNALRTLNHHVRHWDSHSDKFGVGDMDKAEINGA